jgi:hypothetical protein
MYALLKNDNGRIVEGVVLAADSRTLRIAMRGVGDILELHLSDAGWVSDRDEHYEIEALTIAVEDGLSLLADIPKAKVLAAGMPLPQ